MLLYIHIPFCHRVCPYCSFYKHTPGNTPIGAFIEAIATEAKWRKGTFTETFKPTSIYLGGGTPSMLSSKHLSKLFASLQETFDLSANPEITLEANPATFDLKKARHFRDLGVNRVSLGIQSFDPKVLKTLGREHSPKQAAHSVTLLREAEIPSVNIDLMFSIPGQSLETWRNTLQTTIDLNPDHISAYNLTYEQDTAFFESLQAGHFQENEDHDADHYHLAEQLLCSAGFDHYETSNYSTPGHHSRHNFGYWKGHDYLGLGPSAVSTIKGIREKNVPDTPSYIARANSIGHAIHETETLSPEERRTELIALGLRTSEGIPRSLLSPESSSLIEKLSSENLLTLTESHLILTKKGRPLVDPIAAELL